MVKRNAGNRKLNMIDEAILNGLIKKTDKAKYYKHSKSHTLHHLNNMISSGKDFKEAHIFAKSKDRKKKS